jgi:hypothetical protein
MHTLSGNTYPSLSRYTLLAPITLYRQNGVPNRHPKDTTNMVDWLLVWGVSQAVGFLFRPVLEDLAKDVAKDAAKNYVQRCFGSVFSVLYREPLTKATGRALKELLELIQNEMLDADLGEEEVAAFNPEMKQFIRREEVRDAVNGLFLDPDYHLDPAALATAWAAVKTGKTLPEGFSWQRVAKRFARKVKEIRRASSELQATFESLAAERMSGDIHELADLPPGFDLDTYREAVLERYRNLDFEMLDTSGAYYSGVRLWSVFVPQSVRACHDYHPRILELPKEHLRALVEKGELDPEVLQKAEEKEHFELRRQDYLNEPVRPVLDVTDDPKFMRQVILGDPGSGKSSLLRYLALRWARTEDATARYTQPLPLLIELREYSRWECPSGKSFPGYLHKASTWHRLNQQTLDHLLQQPGRVVLLLDGLDEIFDPAHREQVINDIHRFSNDYRNAQIFVTSRVVGYQHRRLRDAGFHHVMLQDLDPDQITQFLDQWHDVTFSSTADSETKRARLKKAIQDSKPIAMLAGNPLLLTMMAILNRHQELPRDRIDLYEQATRVLLQQWDTERALDDLPELKGEVDLRAKREILQRVASHMQNSLGGLAGNIIEGAVLTDLIETFLREELHFDQARAAANAVVKQLRERNFILCFLGADRYAFVHRTFLEYFCAVEIVQRFHVQKSMTEDELVTLFDAHCREDEWREVLRLICGQIDEQFVGMIIETLLDRELLFPNHVEDWPSELTLAIYCLADCQRVSQLTDTGKELMRTCLRLIELSAFGSSYIFLFESLIPAFRELGTNWPGGEVVHEVKDWVGDFLYGEVFHPWVEMVAAVDPRTEVFEALLSHKKAYVRAGAVWHLARNAPTDSNKALLIRIYHGNEDGMVRQAALISLAHMWTDDDDSRKRVEVAVQEASQTHLRDTAIELLAELWLDSCTKNMLLKSALEDSDARCRLTAYRQLDLYWPNDPSWQSEIRHRARIDAEAAFYFASMHSDFGRLAFTVDRNGYYPYMNPQEPISSDHIRSIAGEFGMQSADLDSEVASLSEHMGWDITKGSGVKSGED